MMPSAEHAVLILQRFMHELSPADRLLDLYFREHPHLGAKERRECRELVYTVLRHRRLLARGRDDVPAPGELVARAREMRVDGPDPALAHLPPPVRYSLPQWLWEMLVACWGEPQATALAEASNQPAQVDLRVHRIPREKALAALQAAAIAAFPAPFSPDGLRLVEHRSLHKFSLFQSGALEIQDEGSQLVSRVVAPLPGETVVDLCAGAGGKTLHLASLMKNKGRLLATDLSEARLARLLPRAKRAGVRILTSFPLRHERDPRLGAFAGKAHRVLVDAPCSGSGTLRRNPEIKWRLTPDTVTALLPKQRALLEAGAALVAPGGRLVYATCSLLCVENRDVVNGFLADHSGFRVLSVPHILAQQGIGPLPLDDPFLHLSPHLTGSDGFFVAAFQRQR